MSIHNLRVLLQEPLVPSSVTYGIYSSSAGNAVFPYGPASLARYIHSRGYDVTYLDPGLQRMESKEYLSYIENQRFSIIGIGSTTINIDHALATFELIKRRFPDITTVLGGIHSTLLPVETMHTSKAIDYIVLREAEKPLFRLLECVRKQDFEGVKKISGICYREKSNVTVNPFAPGDHLLPEEIPIPLFGILPMEKYVAQITFSKAYPTYSVIASRGCPFQCSFCNASDVLGKKLRHKSINTVLDEIRILKDEFGAKGIMFHDSTFTANRKWLKLFCHSYRESRLDLPWSCNSRADTIDETLALEMKEAGCWLVSFGIESANQKSLDLLKKGTTVEQNKRAVKLCLAQGLCVNTNYILCLPGETSSDTMNTIRFARKMGNHLASFNLPIPFPKTGMRERIERMGVLRDDAPWSDYSGWDFTNPVYINPLIGRENMKNLRRRAYRSFYTNPNVWYRNCKELILLRQSPRKYWRGLWGLLSSLK